MATRRPAVPRTPAPKRAAPTAPPAGAAETGAENASTVHRAAAGRKAPAGQHAPKTTAEKGMRKAAAEKTASAENKKGAKKGGPVARLSRRKAAAAGSRTPLRTPVPTDETPVPARAFSGRIVALAVVLVAITIMLAPTVRVFLGQRAEIGALQADITAKHAEQDSLKQSIARWEDPNYVKQQARDRINMVMPGETAYWVFGDTAASPATSGSGTGSTGTAPAADKPWAQGFWDSLVRGATD